MFRRRDKLKKNVQTNSIGTQSQITCKPFLVYELKRVDVDAPREVTRETAAVERNHRLRGDENQTNNPFAKSKENNNENKANHKTTREYFAEKNGNHRQAPSSQQLRHQDDYNLRGKHMNQRSRDGDERTRDQSNVERSKRRRSRSGSPSKDRKRARRSRSREQQQRRHRNNHERSSPEKPSRNQVIFVDLNSKQQRCFPNFEFFFTFFYCFYFLKPISKDVGNFDLRFENLVLK